MSIFASTYCYTDKLALTFGCSDKSLQTFVQTKIHEARVTEAAMAAVAATTVAAVGYILTI